MVRTSSKIQVYLEVGKKRTFAGAIEWPGWCRSGSDEASALQALNDYGPRYGRVIRDARLDFQPPAEVAAFTVIERLEGNAGTDFGAPGLAPARDARPVNEVELERLQTVLQACWRTFDRAVKAATGKELRTGPRGGGRELEGIANHVREAESAYLSKLGVKFKPNEKDDLAQKLRLQRQAILKGLAASAHGEIPAFGPRGGPRWTPRYFVRRAAWHVLDHAWEIQDRVG